MNKKTVVIIIGIIITIGIAGAVVYNTNISVSNNENIPNETTPTSGNHFSVELNENVAITGSP